MKNMKYAICLSSGIYNTDEDNTVITYETYTEAREQLDKVDPYGHVSKVEVIIKPTIGKTKTIFTGELILNRLKKLRLYEVPLTIIHSGKNKVPQKFKSHFKTIIETHSVSETFIKELKAIMGKRNEQALVIVQESNNYIDEMASLLMKEQDGFYQVLDFPACTSRYTNNYTLFDLNL